MPQDVLDVTSYFIRNPVKILVKRDDLTLEDIKQFYRRRERGVVAGHLTRPVRDPDHHTGNHLLQHPPQGRLVDRPDDFA